MTARYLVGDVRECLADLPDASVDLVMSSPPFLALRSYLPSDHPDKAREIGSESTPGEFLDGLLDVVVECRRVLAPHGSLVFELGDTYAGSGGAGGDYTEGGLRDGRERYNGTAAKARAHATKERSRRPGAGWPLDKSKVLIPELFAVALSYGMNPLTGRTIEPWRVRNVIAWCRPNPPVGALGDKVRPATSYLTVACMARDRWFDLDAVRTEHSSDPTKFGGNGGAPRTPNEHGSTTPTPGNPAGAPALDWWEIPTAPYKGSHYATYPPELCRRPILMMCPEKVCRTCGEPSRRITQPSHDVDEQRRRRAVGMTRGKQVHDRNDNGAGGFLTTTTTTLGWTDCGHGDWRRGIVLDPFAGSGTTLMVAEGLGRDSVGIDLDARNLDLARQRCGMFLDAAVPGMSTLRSDAKVSHFAAPRAEEAR